MLLSFLISQSTLKLYIFSFLTKNFPLIHALWEWRPSTQAPDITAQIFHGDMVPKPDVPASSLPVCMSITHHRATTEPCCLYTEWGHEVKLNSIIVICYKNDLKNKQILKTLLKGHSWPKLNFFVAHSTWSRSSGQVWWFTRCYWGRCS